MGNLIFSVFVSIYLSVIFILTMAKVPASPEIKMIHRKTDLSFNRKIEIRIMIHIMVRADNLDFQLIPLFS